MLVAQLPSSDGECPPRDRLRLDKVALVAQQDGPTVQRRCDGKAISSQYALLDFQGVLVVCLGRSEVPLITKRPGQFDQAVGDIWMVITQRRTPQAERLLQ